MSNQLKAFLEKCKEAYYAGTPIISDSQYDALEDAFNGTLDIGTQAGRTKHWYKMYSLQKFYTDEEFPQDPGFYVTPKVDGSAVALRYISGKLDSVVTRGNGEYGDNITHLFNEETCAKLNIPYILAGEFTVQVTGEIAAPKDIENARNYAAGALGLKSIEEFKTRKLTFFAYDLQESKLKSYARTLSSLTYYGFITVASSVTEEYPQDGHVYRIDDNVLYKEAGFTSKHPRGAFALKRRSEGVKTTLLDVVWETGKSGKVTPVAILDEVVIDGAKIKRATLNNPGFIQALDLMIGDEVMVERAGGIIPRIIKKAE